MALKEDYLDDILDTSVNEKRKYRMINNADGTISLEDVTEYLQNGDNFGASDINITNKTVNELIAMGLNVRWNKESDYFEVLKDGEWVEVGYGGLQKKVLVLFNYGDAMLEASGGWSSYSYRPSESSGFIANKPVLTINDTNMTLSQKPEQYYVGTVFNDMAIDLTDYSKLCVEAEIPGLGYDNVYFMPGVLSTRKDLYNYDASTIVNADASYNGIIEVNISNVTGNKYIGLTVQNADNSNVAGKFFTVTVKKIWLE